MLTIKVDTEQTEKHYGSLSEKDGTFTLIREADGETRTDEWNDISREQILVFLRSVGWVINKKREEFTNASEKVIPMIYKPEEMLMSYLEAHGEEFEVEK